MQPRPFTHPGADSTTERPCVLDHVEARGQAKPAVLERHQAAGFAQLNVGGDGGS